MNEIQSEPTKTAETVARQAWVKPTVRKIRAGEAEVGTRVANDGAFTTS